MASATTPKILIAPVGSLAPFLAAEAIVETFGREDVTKSVSANSLCYPVTSGTSEWEIGAKIGIGAKGSIIEAKHKDYKEFSYALKHIETSRKSAQKEIDIAIDAAKRGLAPQIYDSWLCSDGAIIVMDRMKETLSSAMSKAESKEELIDLINGSYALVNKFHNIGFSHGDLHVHNIMVDAEGKLKLIDFGSSELTSEASKSQDFERLRSDIKRWLNYAKRKWGTSKPWLMSDVITKCNASHS